MIGPAIDRECIRFFRSDDWKKLMKASFWKSVDENPKSYPIYINYKNRNLVQVLKGEGESLKKMKIPLYGEKLEIYKWCNPEEYEEYLINEIERKMPRFGATTH